MGKIVLDAELRAKLNGATEVTEITDESGRVVGRFVPEGRSYVSDAVYDRVMSALLPPLSDAERAEARAAARKEMLAGDVVSTAEVIAGIEAAIRDAEARR